MSTAIATVIAVLGLLVVFIALWRDAPLDEPGPRLPDWDPLPSRRDLAAIDWPLRVPGYDPATVDQHFELLAGAYADLLAEADPAAIERAQRRAARRLGGLGDDVVEPVQGAAVDLVPEAAPGPRPGSIGAVGMARVPAPPAVAGVPEEARDAAARRGAEQEDGAAHRPDPVQAALHAEASLAAIPRDAARD